MSNPPDWLEQYAKDEWARLEPDLALTAVDLTAFAAYCQSYARWRAAEEWLSDGHGSTVVLRDKDGKVKTVARLPQVQIAKDALADMFRYGNAFGLTPASRLSPASKVQKPLEKPRQTDSERMAKVIAIAESA